MPHRETPSQDNIYISRVHDDFGTQRTVHTCIGIDASTSGGGGGVGGGRLGSDARHHGTLAGKLLIIGSSWPGPLPMFVMAELSCRRELRYHSYSAAPHRLIEPQHA